MVIEPPSIQRISVVTSGQTVTALSDAEKLRRGDMYIDKFGNPKQANIDLRGGDEVCIEQLELYVSRHHCDLCNTKQKSKRVVQALNLRTGVRFYAANDCLQYHLGVSIDNLEERSSLLRLLVNELSHRLELALTSESTTSDALKRILERFDEIVVLPCKATIEAKTELQKLLDNPDLASSGAYDKNIREVQSFVHFQERKRTQPKVFEDQWVALKTDPAKSTGQWPVSLIEHAIHKPGALSLSDIQTLVDTLERAQKHQVLLNNPLKPWAYPIRDTYFNSLDEHYRFEADRLKFPKPYHAVKDDETVGEKLLKDKALPFLYEIYTDFPVKTPLENYAPPNLDTLLAKTKGQVRYVLADEIQLRDIGRDGRVKKVYTRGVAIFVPDRWANAYALWHKHGGDEGRTKLQTLTRDLFTKPSVVHQDEEVEEEHQAKSARPTNKESMYPAKPPLDAQEQTQNVWAEADPHAQSARRFASSELTKLSAQLGRALSSDEMGRLKPLYESLQVAKREGRWDDSDSIKQKLHVIVAALKRKEKDAQRPKIVERKQEHVSADRDGLVHVGSARVRPKDTRVKLVACSEVSGLIYEVKGDREYVRNAISEAHALELKPLLIRASKRDASTPWIARVETSQPMDGLLKSGWYSFVKHSEGS